MIQDKKKEDVAIFLLKELSDMNRQTYYF